MDDFESVTLRSAFARMAGWAELLPSWCDRGEPVAAALQAAAFVEILAHERDRLDYVSEQPTWFNFLLGDLKDIDLGVRLGGKKKQLHPHAVRAWLRLNEIPETHRVSETPRRALRAWQIAAHVRKREEAATLLDVADARLVGASACGRYVIRAEDVDAAQNVFNCCAAILADRDKRRRQHSRVTDEMIVGRVLIQHRTLRNAAAALGLSKSTLGERLNAAIADISARVGPIVAKPVPVETRRPDKPPTEYAKIEDDAAIRWISRQRWFKPKPKTRPLAHVPTTDTGLRLNVPKQTVRAGLDILVDEFLANGGEIKKLPPGRYVATPYCPTVRAQYEGDVERYLSGDNGLSRFTAFAGDRQTDGEWGASLLDRVDAPKTDKEAREHDVSTRAGKAVNADTGKGVDFESFASQNWRKAA
jgi:hypothetical protein